MTLRVMIKRYQYAVVDYDDIPHLQRAELANYLSSKLTTDEVDTDFSISDLEGALLSEGLINWDSSDRSFVYQLGMYDQ